MGYSDMGKPPGARWFDTPGKIMCCICFGQFTEDELAEDDDGQKWDMCKECMTQEQNYLKENNRG